MYGERKATVLIVEDDSGIAYLQSRSLTRAGHTALVAITAENAIETISQRQVDLILLDYLLPNDITGLEFHETLQSLGYDIPVIMVTGYSEEGVVVQAMRAGVRDFVSKASDDYLHYVPVAVERVLSQVALEQRLAESEARFHSFMSHAPAIAVVKDERGRLIYANRYFEQVFETTEWHLKFDSDLWPEEAAIKLRENDLAIFASNQVAERTESLPLPDGSLRQWLFYRFPMPVCDGQRLLGAMAIDITERKAAEETIRKRDEQLRQSQKMEALGTLAGGVAHEFNNLLQAVQGFTRYAMEGLSPSEQRYEDLEQVLSASQRAADLTSQLLSFGRRQPSQPAALRPNDLIQDLMRMIRPLIGEQIIIELDLSPQAPMLTIDASQMQQVLMNLCVNARDAMPDGGPLIVRTKGLVVHEINDASLPGLHPGQYLVLEVSDKGSGILPEHREHIFEPFFTTKEVGKGTGLGLSTVYGIVQQQQGLIQIQSAPQQGTTIRVILPAGRNELHAAPSQPQHRSRPGNEVILVAEDEEIVRDLTLRILHNAGYRTLAAKDGDEAIRMYEQNARGISLAVLDLVMPAMGGRDVYRRMQQINPLAKAVFCSGYEQREFSNKPTPSDDIRIVRKPFDPVALLDAIRDTIDREVGCQHAK